MDERANLLQETPSRRVTDSLVANARLDQETPESRSSVVSLRRRIYAANIQGSGNAKIPDLKIRTAGSDFKVLFETNRKPGGENSINLDCQAISLAASEDKGLAYGTAVMCAKYNPECDLITKLPGVEITAITQQVCDTIRMTVIGGYRSPSMRVDSTKCWYQKLRELIDARVNAGDDIIIVAMDDNSSDKAGRPYRT